MPIPHEVTKDFFAPYEDPIFPTEEFARSHTDQMQNRVNDLLYLFNLLDAAFGRRDNQSRNSNQPNESAQSESSNGQATVSMQNGRASFNLPNFNRVREGVLNHWLENQRNTDQEGQQQNQTESRPLDL